MCWVSVLWHHHQAGTFRRPKRRIARVSPRGRPSLGAFSDQSPLAAVQFFASILWLAHRGHGHRGGCLASPVYRGSGGVGGTPAGDLSVSWRLPRDRQSRFLPSQPLSRGPPGSLRRAGGGRDVKEPSRPFTSFPPIFGSGAPRFHPFRPDPEIFLKISPNPVPARV